MQIPLRSPQTSSFVFWIYSEILFYWRFKENWYSFLLICLFFRKFCFFFYLFQFEIRFGVYLVGVSCIADGDKVCARKAKAIGRRREIKSRCSREFSVISAAGLFAHLSPTLRSRYNSVGALLIALPCATPMFPRRHVFLIGKTDPLRISVWEIFYSCVLLPFSHFQFNIFRNVYSFSIFYRCYILCNTSVPYFVSDWIPALLYLVVCIKFSITTTMFIRISLNLQWISTVSLKYTLHWILRHFYILCAFSTFIVHYTFPCVLEIFSRTTNTKQNKAQP